MTFYGSARKQHRDISSYVNSFADPDYASIEQIKAETAANRKSPTMLRASYDYNPQGPEELILKKGDLIQVF